MSSEEAIQILRRDLLWFDRKASPKVYTARKMALAALEEKHNAIYGDRKEQPHD